MSVTTLNIWVCDDDTSYGIDQVRTAYTKLEVAIWINSVYLPIIVPVLLTYTLRRTFSIRTNLSIY